MERAYKAALACLPDMSVLALPRLHGLVGDAEELWNVLRSGGPRAAALVGEEKAALWREACRSTEPSEVLEGLKRRGIRVLMPKDAGYPERLREIFDPPYLLFVVGGEPPREAPFVAVVGSRRASDYGRWAAEGLGMELARRGVVVVSGAAYGVDGHAHQGCLKKGGFTVAVLGCGVDRVYPAGHAGLLARIAGSGCLLSEYPPGTEPLPWRFPHRNRIIAGLSHVVVVVEASCRSGALITAEMALEEGREVMALPGPINSNLCRGSNALIQKGAKLVSCVDDICEEFPPGLTWNVETTTPEVRDGPGDLSRGENEILELLREGRRKLDWLALKTGEPPGNLLSKLASLTLRGWVAEEAGGWYRLVRG